MNQVISNKYKETYYEETLENGLKVVIWHKPNYEKSHFMLATPLGALDIEQVDESGKPYTFEAGIAHFLEHKMFENGDTDVMTLFSQMGASDNAFTSYTETAYHFTTSQDPIEPLNLLLDFVQQLSISDESVEKEKGIIIQELQMYQQMSDSRLINETFSSLFHNHPFKHDVGGTVETVNRITKESLELCYKINYHPSTMILVGVTGKDVEPIFKSIKENQKKKHFEPISSVTRKIVDEPHTVKREEFHFNMDVTTPKINIAYKMEGIKDPIHRLKMEWALKIILDCHFSSLNTKYQTWLEEGIINDFYGYDLEFGEDFGYMMFYTETLKAEEFKKIIHDQLIRAKNEGVSAQQFEQLQRRYFGQTIRELNNFDDIAINFMRNYFQNIDFFESLDLVAKMDLTDIAEVIQRLDLANVATIYLEPIKEAN